MRAVLDTNVLVAGLRSRKGASYELLQRAFAKDFELPLSIAVFLEYQDVLARPGMVPLSPTLVQTICQGLASIAVPQKIHFRWRPLLPDPRDDMLLELAVASGASHIVTFNIGHLRAASALKVAAIRPADFLSVLP